MPAYEICYGKGKISVDVPEENLIGYFEPNIMHGTNAADTIIKNALSDPIGSPPISAIAKPGHKVAILVDDNTRPTPTHIMLPYILEELHGVGVIEKDITIIFANGSHRMHTREEKIRLLGGAHILEKYRVWDHDPGDMENIKYLGRTSRNTPVHVNRYAAEADLRILLGLIKPHCVAGYTGGGKSILPGVSSIETIISDHNYEATRHKNSVLGVIDGNPIRSDLEEAASLVYPSFILNVVLDEKKGIVYAVAGDMIKAHRAGAAKLDELVCKDIPEEADIVIAGCSYPTSVNLYQSANILFHCIKLEKPIIKKGGIIIAASPCPEGVGGGGRYYETMKEAESAAGALEKIAQPGFFMHDQWAVQLWATCLLHSDVYLVSGGLTRQEKTDMKAEHYDSAAEALAAALEKKGMSARITVLPDAPYVIPRLRTCL